MSDTNSSVTRRRFCAGACQFASGATLATFVSACGGSPSSPNGDASLLGVVQGAFSGGTVQVPVAGSALADAGGAVLVQSVAGVFLVSRSSSGSFTAVDAVCSHMSCTITGYDGSIYVCPCHGSRYDHNGRVVGGPAPASLRQFGTTVADGVVTIAL